VKCCYLFFFFFLWRILRKNENVFLDISFFFEYFLPRSLVKVNSRQNFESLNKRIGQYHYPIKKLATKNNPNDTWLNDYFFPHLHPFDHSRTVGCPPLKSNLLYTRWKSDTPTFVWFTKLHNVNVYKEHIFPVKLYLISYQ